MTVLEFLNKYKSEIFIVIVVIVHYILYILILLKFNIVSKQIVDKLNTFLQVCISLFLIYKFGFAPNNHIISGFDKRVIVTSATFIIFNVFIKDYSNYEERVNRFVPIKKTTNYINNQTKSINDYLPVSR
jgi:DNA integrity scanning protein DisA with diadenylate cyclase activity